MFEFEHSKAEQMLYTGAFYFRFSQKFGQNGAPVLEQENKTKVWIGEAMEDFEKFYLALTTKYSSNKVKSEISDEYRLKIVASCMDGIN